jgi:hypothetical protein
MAKPWQFGVCQLQLTFPQGPALLQGGINGHVPVLAGTMHKGAGVLLLLGAPWRQQVPLPAQCTPWALSGVAYPTGSYRPGQRRCCEVLLLQSCVLEMVRLRRMHHMCTTWHGCAALAWGLQQVLSYM